MADDTQNTDDNAKQAQALIDALAPKLAETILPQLTAHVEDQIKGIKDNSERLLSRLHKEKEEKSTLQEALDALGGQVGDIAKKVDVPPPAPASYEDRMRARLSDKYAERRASKEGS